MKRILLLLTSLLSILFAVSPALAQTPPALSAMEIELWPEYDKPSVLVIFRGTVAPNVPLPVTLTFEIPSKFTPLAVAYQDPQGLLYDLKYTTTASVSTTALTFSVPTNSFQFEYYDTTLDTTTPSRKFNFGWRTSYPIQALSLVVQQPVNASNFSTTPKTESSVGADGLTYFKQIRSNVSANEPITLEMAYTKNDSILTASTVKPPAAEPVSIATPAASSSNNQTLIITIIAALAVVAVFGGVVWAVRNREESAASPESAPRRHKEKGHPPRPKEVNPAKSGTAAAFCHQCGEPAAPDDNFCRKCGTQIRR